MGNWELVVGPIEISAAHKLNLPYESKCKNLHGHNYKVIVRILKTELDENGMVVDVAKVKEVVKKYDHRNLNEFMEQPTMEILAKKIADEIEEMVATSRIIVEVQETEGGKVVYSHVPILEEWLESVAEDWEGWE